MALAAVRRAGTSWRSLLPCSPIWRLWAASHLPSRSLSAPFSAIPRRQQLHTVLPSWPRSRIRPMWQSRRHPRLHRSRKDLPVVHGSRAQHQRTIVEARRKAQMAKLRERRLTQEARQMAEPMGVAATAGPRSPRPELCAGPRGSVRRYLVKVDPTADLRPVATSAELRFLSALRSNFRPALLLSPVGPFISGEFRAHRRHSPDQSENKLDHDPPDVL